MTHSQNALAALLSEVGEKPAARRMLDEVIARQTAQLGASHPDTLDTKHNLCLLLEDLGREEQCEARGLYAEVLAGQTSEVRFRAAPPGTYSSSPITQLL